MARGHPVHEVGGSVIVLTAAEDDRAAVARFLRDRTERSFGVLYAQHTPAMLGLATRLLQQNRSDGEDAVQEAWIRAIAALSRFAWRSTLRTWLCGFVVNCCRERLRSRPAGGEASEAVDTIDVERAIASMPAAAREVFVLHEIYGYSHEEIGEIAGIDAGTSKSQLHHARRAFRAHFEARDGKRTE